MKRYSAILIASLSALILGTTPARAAIVLDSDFFLGIPHTLLTFETDGSGSPVVLGGGNFTYFEGNEYAHLGFTFAPGVSEGVAWVGGYLNMEPIPGGTPEIALAARDNNGDFFIDFSIPVRSFGFLVIHGSSRPGIPAFEAYSSDDLVQTVRFQGDAINGITDGVDYGFLGIALDQDITRVHVTGDVASLDNFTFSPVPEPAALSLLLLGTGFMAVRKRNRV
jgi:PEP-CTERM motif-containing protein